MRCLGTPCRSPGSLIRPQRCRHAAAPAMRPIDPSGRPRFPIGPDESRNGGLERNYSPIWMRRSRKRGVPVPRATPRR